MLLDYGAGLCLGNGINRLEGMGNHLPFFFKKFPWLLRESLNFKNLKKMCLMSDL